MMHVATAGRTMEMTAIAAAGVTWFAVAAEVTEVTEVTEDVSSLRMPRSRRACSGWLRDGQRPAPGRNGPRRTRD